LATLGLLENEPDEFQPESGFELLFNGKDLTGWGYRPTPEKDLKFIEAWKKRDPNMPPWPVYTEPAKFDGKTESSDGRYVVKYGRLIVKTPCEGRRIQQLWTTREFPGDIVLRLEFRATPNADSGVFIREPQLQCRDYTLAGPFKELKKYKPQEWNDLEIIVTGNKARAACNGELLVENMELPATGPIGLEGDRGQMEYRRIRLKAGKPAPAPSTNGSAGPITRKEDVIYGRKTGVALTMDVFTPEKPNGLGVVFVVSGGWYSGHEAINGIFFNEVANRGYTVFAVVHGSQPKFAIPEILGDMNRAVRFIRHYAADYKIDPDRIGIMGGSAGGHLSLMQGTAGAAGDPKAGDPVDRESSRVQAVACFFPPTDFLNYGKPGEIALGRGKLKDFRGAFDFQEWDEPTHHFVEITDEAKIEEIGKQISPITHVSSDDPPTLIIHGDADTLVPIQQAKIMVDKLKEAGVAAELMVKPGAGHGWGDLPKDLAKFADWFDVHLKDGAK
jgi:acetyl esterase/lipase